MVYFQQDSVNEIQGSVTDSVFVLHGKDSVRLQTEESEFRFSDAENDSAQTVFSTGEPTDLFLFKEHKLQTTATSPISKAIRNPDWFIIVLIMVIIYFTWIRVFNYKVIKQHFAAFTSNLLTNQIVRDENILVQRTSVLLSLVFYFIVALFFYQVSIYFKWNYKIFNEGFVRYVIFVLLIASAYSLKMVLLKMLGILFRIDKAVSTYIFNIFLINNIIGMVFIPLVILIAFVAGITKFLLWTGVVMLLFALIYRLFRGIAIWMSMPKFSLYYLILYLCALEIAPLLVLFKLA